MQYPPTRTLWSICALGLAAAFGLASPAVSAQTSVRTEIQFLAESVSQDSLLRTLRVLTGEEEAVTPDSTFTIATRLYSQNDGAYNYILRYLEGLGLQTNSQPFLFFEGMNVLAYRFGATNPDELVILCAHYDAVERTPGADDNGSGTAAVLEAARLFATVETDYTILFALWDAEEIGLRGARHYAELAAAQGTAIRGVVNLDMIAWDGDGDSTVEVHTNNEAGSVAKADLVAQTQAAYSIPVTTRSIQPGTSASDHAAFWTYGYPAVLLIEEYRSGDFNPYYHGPDDTISNLSLPFMTEVTRLAVAAIAELAGTRAVLTDTHELVPGVADLALESYPNPFRDRASIRVRLSHPGFMSLAVFDLLGREVARLADGSRAAGSWHFTFESKELPAGVYVVSVTTDTGTVVRPIVLAR